MEWKEDDVAGRLKIGLLPRVAVALGVVGFLPLLMTAVSLFRLDRDAMTSQVLRTHSVAARATADRLGTTLKVLRETVLDGAEVALEAGMPVGGLFRELLASNDDLCLVSLENEAGEELVRAQRRSEVSVLEKATAGAPPGGLAIREIGGQPWLVVSWPLRRERMRVVAVVRAGRLVDLLRPKELGRDAEMAIVDGSGSIVLGERPGTRPFPAAMVSQAARGRTSGSGRFRLEDGRWVLGAWAPVSGTDWVVISRQPASVAEAVARRAARRATIALALALALTVGLTVAAYRSLVRPLRRVLALQRQVGGLAPGGATGDELEDLRSSLNTLERRNRDRREIGDVFLGRYRIIEVLGEGAMGTVFRGWDPKLQRGVALKTIRLDELLPDRREEFVGHLMHEAVAAARLTHPNVVGVYDVVEQGEAAFLAMELVEGLSLQKLLRSRGRLEAGEAAHIGRAVARALTAAHDAGLVHHDVKPGNILLGFEGEIKVTDFGIAKFVNDASEDSAVVYGTPGYIPPETLQGHGYDELGDVFALGVVLFQSLAGKLPRVSSSFGGPSRAPAGSGAEMASRYNPEVPEDLDRLIQALLAVDRSARIPSARVAARRLDRLVELHGWVWSPPGQGGDSQGMEVDSAGDGMGHSRFVRTRVLRGGRDGGGVTGDRPPRGGTG